MQPTRVRSKEKSPINEHDIPYDNRPMEGPKTAEDSERDSPPIRLSRKGKEKVDSDQARLGAMALEGMALLRSGMTDLAQVEQHRIQEARHDYYRTIDTLGARLGEEKGHLKFIQGKVDMKALSLAQFMEQLAKAKVMLEGAKSSVGQQASDSKRSDTKSIVKSCEDLVESWEKNVDLAIQRLHYWEFKCNKQIDLVTKLTADLNKAESRYADVTEQFNSELKSLKAVSELLRNL